MRKWYKRVTALVLAALMTVHHGGSSISALADQTGTDNVHEDGNSEEEKNSGNSDGTSTDDPEDKDQQDLGNASDNNGDTDKNQDADHQDVDQNADQNADYQDADQNAGHQAADQNADKNTAQDGQNDQNSKSEGSQSDLNAADSKSDQNENGTDKKDSLSDPSDIKQDGEKDQENTPSENSSGQQEKDNEEEDEEIPTATSSEASRQDTETDSKEAAKQKKHTIYSWEWFEGEDYLVDGEQFITVNEGDNISSDMIAETLPKAISATLRYEDATMWTEWVEDIDVEKWICDEYVQDENGNWPTEGEFIFTAVLPEDYELAEGVKGLEVKVTLVDSGVALLAEDDFSYYIKINNGGTTPASGNGYTIAEKSEGNYTLTLDNFTGSSIFLRRGTWEVVLKGTNTVTNDEDNLTPLSIWNDIYVTVRGTGELNLISK